MSHIKLKTTQKRTSPLMRAEDTKKDGVVRVRLSKEIPDAHNSIFKLSGMDISRLKKESGVYLGHRRSLHKGNLPVAKLDNVTKGIDEDGVRVLDADLVFDMEDEAAKVVYKKVRDGYISSLSIVASIDPSQAEMTEDSVVIFNKSTLIGADLVSSGSNKAATVLRSMDLDAKEREILIKNEIIEDSPAKELNNEQKRGLVEAAELILEVFDDVDTKQETETSNEEDNTLIDGQEECAEDDVRRTYLDQLLGQVDSENDWLEDFEF